MIVATGNFGAIAERMALSTLGAPACLNPEGTVCRILIGYVPFAERLWRVYSHADIVRTTITKAFRRTEIKKNSRAETHAR
jgi:hypothetical protein